MRKHTKNKARNYAVIENCIFIYAIVLLSHIGLHNVAQSVNFR